MHTLDLTYVGHGLHEELVAYVADQEGFPEQEGVHLAVRDGVSWDDERLRRGATIGLGRSVFARLTDGVEWTALSVSTHRPLFWFVGGPHVGAMEDLRGRRLLVHAPHTAPGCFARIVLRRHGLDPDHDLECVVRPPGDYAMDLRRLRAGEVDAAYLGSTLDPAQVAAEEGFHELAWVGDHLAVPTVGLAVDPAVVSLDDPAVAAAVRAQRRALALLAADPETAVAYLQRFLGRDTPDEVRRYHDRFVAPWFTSDGQVDLAAADEGLAAVADELGVAHVPRAADVYRTEHVARSARL
ncbi:ABC transporter substrate-binding protein [Actinomycetospora endophytica]|uniref:ABC transporter substrate-binding protein n=1 Tax=Actinomycetospora endophytica TaxID=2291215 RepID=A0ABS8PIV6_9PSEU|nr:ABC transporter substrate-binding protein [Actinomycetospora endophytica]MCD2198203.1 ABC transporter substrate-binding protein [Actinomycetospora endophytica]